MYIAIVDDERHAVDGLSEIVRLLCPDCELHGFQLVGEFLRHLEQNPLDLVFLDIEMPGASGLAVAKRIKELRPGANIVFVTGYSQYALEAHGLYVTGYLLKPPAVDKVREALSHLRNPITKTTGVLRVQCFGNFDVFFSGAPVAFKYSKSRELFAYLVDRRGASCTTGELCAALFGDKAGGKAVHSYFRNLASNLFYSLKVLGVGDALVKSRNSYAVNPSRMDCDYYRYIGGDPAAVNSYGGEYMSQYSWAEMTLGWLERRQH